MHVAAAAAAAAAVTAQQRERSERGLRATERALGELLASPGPLSFRHDSQPVFLFFVYLDTLHLLDAFADTRLQIRIRYGGNGVYQEKYSQKVRSSASLLACSSSAPDEQALRPGILVQLESLEANQQLNGQVGLIEAWDFQRARWLVRLDIGEVKAVQTQNLRVIGQSLVDFGAMIVFRWDPTLPPCITLDLLRLGFFDSVLSRVSVNIPFNERLPGSAEHDLLLFRKVGSACCFAPPRRGTGAGSSQSDTSDEPSLLGHLGIAAELRRLVPEELELGIAALASAEMGTLLQMFAQPQAGIPLPTPGSDGIVIGQQSGATPVVVGQPVHGTGARVRAGAWAT